MASDPAPQFPALRMRIARIAAYALLGAVAAVAGCITPHRSAAVNIRSAEWREPVEIAVPNDDTLSLRGISLFLRCNERFAEDTLTVRIEVRTPDSLRLEEPFTLVIPRRTAPAALKHEAVVPYRRRVRFARTGDYRIRITPSRAVRGVEAVGIDIENNS